MVPKSVYLLNLLLVDQVKHIPGLIVECGVWKGGLIAGIAKILGNSRKYILFDSFEGLPPAQDIDGETAKKWQADTESPTYFDNCTAAEADAQTAMAMSGVDNYSIVKGWFDNTLDAYTWDSPIAVLRLDGDWYDSTLTCLNSLFPRVAKGGIIIIDDYYTWDGCSKAVHDYLSQEQRTERIAQFYNRVCYLVHQ